MSCEAEQRAPHEHAVTEPRHTPVGWPAGVLASRLQQGQRTAPTRGSFKVSKNYPIISSNLQNDIITSKFADVFVLSKTSFSQVISKCKAIYISSMHQKLEVIDASKMPEIIRSCHWQNIINTSEKSKSYRSIKLKSQTNKWYSYDWSSEWHINEAEKERLSYTRQFRLRTLPCTQFSCMLSMWAHFNHSNLYVPLMPVCPSPVCSTDLSLRSLNDHSWTRCTKFCEIRWCFVYWHRDRGRNMWCLYLPKRYITKNLNGLYLTLRFPKYCLELQHHFR